MSKEKGKSHPFAGHLRDTEEILWISARANTISWQRALYMGIGVDIAITIFIILMIAMNGYFRDYDVMAVVWIALITTLLCSPVAFVLVFTQIRTQHRTQQIYAVTNERLLYRIEQSIKTITLENIPAISVFQGSSAKGTLSFGAEFPMWPDVENTAAVKQIIEDAKAQRTQTKTL